MGRASRGAVHAIASLSQRVPLQNCKVNSAATVLQVATATCPCVAAVHAGGLALAAVSTTVYCSAPGPAPACALSSVMTAVWKPPGCVAGGAEGAEAAPPQKKGEHATPQGERG